MKMLGGAASGSVVSKEGLRLWLVDWVMQQDFPVDALDGCRRKFASEVWLLGIEGALWQFNLSWEKWPLCRRSRARRTTVGAESRVRVDEYANYDAHMRHRLPHRGSHAKIIHPFSTRHSLQSILLQ